MPDEERKDGKSRDRSVSEEDHISAATPLLQHSSVEMKFKTFAFLTSTNLDLVKRSLFREAVWRSPSVILKIGNLII